MVAQFIQSTRSADTKPAARYITQSHWKAFETKVESLVMEPEEFLQRWDCTYEEIAKICKCSRNTVANWFCKGKNGKRPSEAQKMWLGAAHKLLLVTRD